MTPRKVICTNSTVFKATYSAAQGAVQSVEVFKATYSAARVLYSQ